ncbi:WD repeat-containing protein 27 [Irineochytrium annulatum]|nr:WD repeat-containing protein 27 [Irineochytrium annulatum]
MLLSHSLDGVGCLWNLGCSEPLLKFSGKDDLKSKVESKINAIKFFHCDELVLTTGGRSLTVLALKIIDKDPKLIKPGLNNNSYRVRKKVEFESGITSFACINNFKSHLAFVGAGTKLFIYDVGVGSVVRKTETTHSRAIHAIALADYKEDILGLNPHLYATAAITDCIKLWDLRYSAGAVSTFAGHINRYAQIGCSLSPCGRYVATGSENKQVYLFDTRKPNVPMKIAVGSADVVNWVDFHPRKPLIAAACQDGKMKVVRLTES